MPSPTCQTCKRKIRVLSDLFYFDDGTRVCGLCYNCEGPMEILVGDTVEVVDINGVSQQHPTEDRNIKNGDILVVKRLSMDGSHIFLHDDRSSMGLRKERFRRVEALIEKECTCPDLINGHHPGCPYLR